MALGSGAVDAWSVAAFVAGVVVLVVGAEALVRGAARVAARTGMSSVVIGLTVVAFGTSAPELAVSVQSAIDDSADIALGNVVGSNIANVLLVLGLSAVVGGGLVVAQRLVRLDVPIMVLVSAVVLVMAIDREINRLDGAILVVALVVYVTWTVVAARRSTAAVTAEYDGALEPERLRQTPVAVDLSLVGAGLVGLVLGARFLVSSATDFAEALGVSDLVIGLTVVAVGTSLPEIATSVIAAVRGERDLAVGNAIGSNLFNLLCVLGITAVVSPSVIPVSDEALALDLPVMLGVAIACLPVFFNGYSLKRWEGSVFLGYYLWYLVYLVLEANEHDASGFLAAAFWFFVFPLTVLTLAVVGVRAWRAHQGRLAPVGGGG